MEESICKKNKTLQQHDPEIYNLIQQEKQRQHNGIELIASENFTSHAVMECLGSVLTNKYSEGYPGKRYYGGNQVIDEIETLCQQRALSCFSCNPNEWGVNVQPYSGSPANFAVYTALLRPHDRIMGLDLPSGGHLTHGFYTLNKKDNTRKPISATSVYFESLPYKVNEKTGIIDYASLRETAALFKPALLICGGSAYTREWDYDEFRKIADENGSLLMCDMAHISGLIATKEAKSPFDVCDIVTTTTHKSLRGPRAGMIFYKRDKRNFEERINNAVFPALQGGPHQHQIAALATQLHEVAKPEFKKYAIQIKANAKALANTMIQHSYTLVTHGTDNHLVLWDVRPLNLTGSKIEKLCEICHITVNKNAVHGDKSALTPGGVRIGTPACTTRGYKEKDFQQVGEFLHEIAQLALNIQQKTGKKLINFMEAARNDHKVTALADKVKIFASKFSMPGI